MGRDSFHLEICPFLCQRPSHTFIIDEYTTIISQTTITIMKLSFPMVLTSYLPPPPTTTFHFFSVALSFIYMLASVFKVVTMQGPNLGHNKSLYTSQVYPHCQPPPPPLSRKYAYHRRRNRGGGGRQEGAQPPPPHFYDNFIPTTKDLFCLSRILICLAPPPPPHPTFNLLPMPFLIRAAEYRFVLHVYQYFILVGEI